jgi:hypothetical protein
VFVHHILVLKSASLARTNARAKRSYGRNVPPTRKIDNGFQPFTVYIRQHAGVGKLPSKRIGDYHYDACCLLFRRRLGNICREGVDCGNTSRRSARMKHPRTAW